MYFRFDILASSHKIVMFWSDKTKRPRYASASRNEADFVKPLFAELFFFKTSTEHKATSYVGGAS